MTEHLTQQEQLLDLAQDCVKQLSLDGRIVAINAPGVARFGAPNAGALIGRAWAEFWPAQLHPKLEASLEAARAGGSSRFVAAAVGPDGQRRWWSVSVGPLTDDKGQVTAVGAVSRDITERIQLEASLDSINHSLRDRLQAAEETIATGVRREASLTDELAAAGRATRASHEKNVQLHDRLDLASLAQAAAERVAQQAQKGEAIGQLVAGLSHDFNNNLQTVISALDALSGMGDLTPRQSRFTDYALTAARHAAVMSRRLLAFSRVHPYQPNQLDLAKIVSDVVPMMSDTLGRDMRIQLVAAAEPLPVFADGHSVQQGIMNLCVNARDACEGRGTIRVAFGVEHIPATAATLMLPEGDYVFADVIDDGPGMPDEVRERLFQPFFTTKPPGKGTGLGMAQVMSSMRQARGSVEVQTAVGQGTRVRLLFPRAEEPASMA